MQLQLELEFIWSRSYCSVQSDFLWGLFWGHILNHEQDSWSRLLELLILRSPSYGVIANLKSSRDIYRNLQGRYLFFSVQKHQYAQTDNRQQ